ncbi:MAG: peptidoglycan editing factor PgeF [Duodenibacillus sp.]
MCSTKNKQETFMDFKNELSVMRPQLGDGVGALFTERAGGVSSGPWGTVEGIMGLNVGSRVSDNAACVRMNRAIVAQMTPSEPRWMTQVHGTRVVRAEEVGDESCEADAQVTTVPGVVCTVQVADCLPVLLADERGRGVAAVHAGWRSLAGGVIENAVRALREAVGDEKAALRAWLGPRIGFEDFETGPEVVQAFEARYPNAAGAVKPAGEGKFLVSLAAFAKAALADVDVTAIDDCGLSTVADPVRFYSYRRDGEKTGRHAAMIWLKAADQ